ncbi:hypothetical protein WA026_017357 [Henosepilachna vigintioctopunctata]|uniref:CBM39 domain-containing protein n=1 Tax=Henosepilachna vigintioctopunctata TaxID=420089 RepID=A0AAW1VGS5_9CUCU
MFKLVIVYLLLMQCSLFACDFTFPDVKLEAFKPEGFKASIPETEGVKLFAFHGNKNRNLSQVEPGEFNRDIVNPKLNGWSYFNPNLKLNIGDKVYYWVFIQHGQLGYRQVNQVWEVTELSPLEKMKVSVCVNSETEILGRNEICSKQLIFDSTFFDNVIDEVNWKRAHFIAQYPVKFHDFFL